MNGISERTNRVLVEHGRTLLTEAGLSPLFWSYAVKHVAYLRNRLWHRHHQQGPNVGASPYQALYGKAPPLSMLRVWGCDAYKLDPLYKSSTFGRKAQKMILVGMSANRKGWVLFDPKTRKTTTTFHASFDEDMVNRRCALRDFDLRQHKAGPGGSRDDERLALLERELYTDDSSLTFQDPASLKDHGASEQDTQDPASLKDLGVEHHVNDKTREQHAEGRSIGEHHVKGTLDERQEQSEAYKGHKKDHQQGHPRMGGSERRNGQSEQAFSPPLVQVPQRRASVGSAQDLDEQDFSFLRMAFEMNLPCEVLQRNHKREKTASRRRYEQYKQGTTLRQIKNLGATWADIVWDFSRGYITFNKAAASNAVIEQLVDEWMEARQRPSRPAAYVSSSGKLVASGPLMSFEESIQQDYATLAV